MPAGPPSDGPVCYCRALACSAVPDFSLSIAMVEYPQLIGHVSTFEDFARNAESGKPIASYLWNAHATAGLGSIATVANMAMPEKYLLGANQHIWLKAHWNYQDGCRPLPAQQGLSRCSLEILKYG